MKINPKLGNVVWTVVKLLLVCYVVTGLILAAIALIMLKSSPSSELVSGGIVFAYVISTFVGGLLFGKKMGSRKYLWGIMFGMLYFAIVYIISLFMNPIVGEPVKDTVTIFLLCSAGGMLGGMLG